MKKCRFLAITSIAVSVLVSCQNNDINEETQQPDQSTLSKTHLAALVDAGINPADAIYEEFAGLPGDPIQTVVKAGDLMLNIEALEKGEYALGDNGQNKQYRTNNLVRGNNRSFRIVGYTGQGNALTSKMRTALQWAVNNYNRLNTSIRIELVFQSNFNNSDMVVYNNNRSGGGGSAGFPFNGRSFNRVQINAGTDSFSTNVVEHVITHEIGHSIGFRHQDWRSRQSCGQNSNEGTAGVGAILINGTPSSDRADSIMLACFGPNEDGEFTNSDITAMNALY